jgi:hypothetical protein
MEGPSQKRIGFVSSPFPVAILMNPKLAVSASAFIGNKRSRQLQTFSVFSLTPTPKVTSGNQAMEFYWDSDQLKFKFTTVTYHSNKTMFTFPIEGTNSFLWKKRDLRILLARMIVFTKHLHKISLIAENELSLEISKEFSDVPKEMNVLNIVSPSRLFSLGGTVTARTISIHISVCSRFLAHLYFREKWILFP